MEPEIEYTGRLARWSRNQQFHERRHCRLGTLRIWFAVVLIALALFVGRVAPTMIGVAIAGLIAGLFFSGMIHDRVLSLRDRAWRGVRFYQAGLDRLRDQWMGKGSPGTEFLDPHHPYAIDLDLFGPGSVFELVNRAQTQGGRATLARWLLRRAASGEIRLRQEAVAEMRPKLDLREQLALLAGDPKIQIDTDALIAWAARPRALESAPARAAAFCLPLLTWGSFLVGEFQLSALFLAAQIGLRIRYQKRVKDVFNFLTVPAAELNRLAGIFKVLAGEKFESTRLRELQNGWVHDGVAASEWLRQLARLLDLLDSREHLIVRMIGPFFLLDTQLAFALEARRAGFGEKIEDWLRRLGEMEALSSLAGHAFEHPADPFPELLPESEPARIQTQGLGHPLIPETRVVRNDLAMDPEHRLIVVSGSNMSGKSTWLRALGVNLALATAGGVVRARRMQLTPLQLGASIRTLDSLNESISRFYAEIKRLRQIIDLTEEGAVLFLVDEVLQGTNSHDRRIGAAYVVKALLERGAMGLITTHDLALTQIVDETQPRGANFHFEDQFKDGKMSFDYQLRPGVVEKSNALALMRSIGLDVD